MNLVTARIDSGIRAATKRKKRFDTTMAGAASQTIRITGGIFLSALNRSVQLGSFIAGLAAAIASVSLVRNVKNLNCPDALNYEFARQVCQYTASLILMNNILHVHFTGQGWLGVSSYLALVYR